MKKQTKIIFLIIIIVLAVGIILTDFYINKNVGPVEENQTNNSTSPVPSATSIDYSTLEATILNLSTEMTIINNAGVSGELHGTFAKVRVDKIINYTRYDSRNELKFDPLIFGDIINVAMDINNLSIGDKILVNIYAESDSGEIVLDKFNLWFIDK